MKQRWLPNPTAAQPVLAQDGGVRTLSLETYLDMQTVSDPQASPEGTQVARVETGPGSIHRE